MTNEEVNTLISGIATAIKCDYAYSLFKSGKRTRFLIFYYNGADDLYADGTNYQEIDHLTVEFYAPKKEINTEKTIQKMLNDAGLTYDKFSAYISSESLNLTTYTMEVIING